MRIAQDGHLESEEAFVLPEAGERMSTAPQLDLAKLLLIDEEAEDPRWILDSIKRELSTAECKLLEDLEDRFTEPRPAVDELDEAADS